MAHLAKQTERSRAVAFAGLILVAVASGQAPPGILPHPTIPDHHPRARELFVNAMRYARPSNQMTDPVSGYPFEGWNQDPKRGLYLRSFTQLTAIGQWMELLATVAGGYADTPHLSREQALTDLSRLVKTLRADQTDPTLAAKGLLGNFLDLATGKRLGPLASSVDHSKFLETFGGTKGEALWKALKDAGWINPRLDGTEADITRGESYGDGYFKGALASWDNPDDRRKVMMLLDRRVVMLIFGDNANLTTSIAKTIGALLVPELKDRPEAIVLRDQLERFIEAQTPGYSQLYDPKSGLFDFGWDATRDRRFGWDDLQGKRVIGHMDYLVNEFRGPSTFIAARFGLPVDAIKNLGFKMKPYQMKDGREVYTLAPWEGSAFQALGLGLSLHEPTVPGWREILRNLVEIEVDFSEANKLPGFLSESYTGAGTQYTGSVGIPAITVSPRPRITDAASLYTLGAAYSVAPDQVERFLEANWPTISTLLTDHGPWEGFNVTLREPIQFQTTAHTLALILGMIGRGSANMSMYIHEKKLVDRFDELFPRQHAGVDLLATSPVFAWTSKDARLESGKEGTAFHVKGDQLRMLGIAFASAEPAGIDLSGGLLTFGYRSANALDSLTIELKPSQSLTYDSGLISRAITVRIEATGPEGRQISVPLPATPGLTKIKEVVIYHERADRGPVDLTITHLMVSPIGPR